MKEPAGLLPGSDDQPADVLIPFWTNGQDSTLDVTVVNPLQAGLVVRASQEGQSAVESAHYGKVRKHEERCPNEGITFTPLAVDTLGEDDEGVEAREPQFILPWHRVPLPCMGILMLRSHRRYCNNNLHYIRLRISHR